MYSKFIIIFMANLTKFLSIFYYAAIGISTILFHYFSLKLIDEFMAGNTTIQTWYILDSKGSGFPLYTLSQEHIQKLEDFLMQT